MRRRVAIIGGGIAGLTAAFQLTRTPRERARWEVTIYEMGHRFGGRLASAHHSERWGRNEEHGLHVWFGFYDNVFRLADEVWRDFPRPEGCPWSTVWDGLRPIYTSDHGLVGDDGLPLIRRVHHPRNGAQPGATETISVVGMLTGLADAARAVAHTLLSLGGHGPGAEVGPGGPLFPFPSPDRDTLLQRIDRVLDRVVARALKLELAGSKRARREMGRLIERFVRSMHTVAVSAAEGLAGDDPGRVEMVHVLDVALAAIRALASPLHGILDDGDFDRVSHLEIRELLRMHGARPKTLAESQLIEALYDMPFAYRNGDRSQPVMEAGTALRYALRMAFDFKHAIAYLLAAGAGETIVAPLYALLRERGVRFRPFHRLDALRIDRSRRSVVKLELVRAARAASDYDPLIVREGFLGFRSDPHWSVLEGGEALEAREVDFYSRFADRGESTPVVLEHGRDFDDVVLALPLGCIAPDGDGHSPVADWLDVFPKARACLERLHLVPTLAAQLWFSEPPDEVGLSGKAVVTWSAPYSVVCDMSPVIAHEAWPSPPPKSCAYLCGAWPLEAHRVASHDRAAKKRDEDLARSTIEQQLARDGETLLAPGTTLYSPDGVGDPWAAQYVRANVEPWDLADLPLPGANAVRLEANESGLDNLALAGSWVRTHVNTTSMEAAVSSGIAAARALGCDTQPILAEALFRRAPTDVLLPQREKGISHVRRSGPTRWPSTEWLCEE